jgi:hypothetical protein
MPSACTIKKRKRGAWGPDDYFLKCKEGTVGYWATMEQAKQALAKSRQQNKSKK